MEINKCLEDPNTVYSDQYMPLAMMPAVIEAIQQGGGGNEDLMFAFMDTMGDELTCSVTYADMSAKILSGGRVFIYSNEANTPGFAGTTFAPPSEPGQASPIKATQVCIDVGNSLLCAYTFTITSDDTVTESYNQYTLTPVSEAD